MQLQGGVPFPFVFIFPISRNHYKPPVFAATPLNSPPSGNPTPFVQNSQKIIDWMCTLGRVTISFFAHGPDNKLDSHTITKFALPQKIFGPIVQRI